MDHVDSTLRTILREVNTLEEFEKEKAIFQVNINRHRAEFSVLATLRYLNALLHFFLRFHRTASDFDGKYINICIFSFLLCLMLYVVCFAHRHNRYVIPANTRINDTILIVRRKSAAKLTVSVKR